MQKNRLISKVSLIGYGELGKQFSSFLNELGHNEYCFFDDSLKKLGEKNAYYFNEFIDNKFNGYEFYVSIGYKHLKLKNEILINLKELGRRTPSFIHQTSYINKAAIIEDGVFIYPMSNIDKNTLIKQGTLLNNSVIVSHDSSIGKCCYLSPGVVVSGNVIIGDFTFVGSGSVIANNINIGSNVKIGIGSVITQDIPDNVSVIGNPMRILDNDLSLV